MQRDRSIRLLDRSAEPAFAMRERGEIWSWNRAAEELFGYSDSEAHLAHDITLARRREALTRRLTEAARRRLTSTDARSSGSSGPWRRGTTLRNHLHHINQKLGTHTRLEAVTHAIRRNLV